MDQLIISNGITNLTLPKVKYYIGDVEESRKITMASGKVVKEMLGYRKTITATYSYIRAGHFQVLTNLIRNNGFLNVTYTDKDGQNKTESFSVTTGQNKVYKFINGEPFWEGAELVFESQEVY